MVIGTLAITRQIHYIQNKNLGFDKEQVFILNNAHLLGDRLQTFKEDMLTNPEIISGTTSRFFPSSSMRDTEGVFPDSPKNKDKITGMEIWAVDHDYIPTLGLSLLSGRDFNRKFPTDKEAAIINQEAAKRLGWTDPLGKKLGFFTSARGDHRLLTVIGVIEDFHVESLKNAIPPLLLYIRTSTSNIIFRLKTENIGSTVDIIRRSWSLYAPHQPFEYSFLDERFNALFHTELRIKNIVGVFTYLAIFIGCLGLFGLVSFATAAKTKEIGIRRVHGASAGSISWRLLREFLLLVGLANILAWPAAYFLINRWLRNFAYRAPLGIWIFGAAALATLGIALLTVGYLTIKAARANPVNSLRYE
jgi:putative ABC transport system permease protein